MEKQTSVSAIVSFWLTAILSVFTMAGFGYTYLRDSELRFSALEARIHRVEQHNEDRELSRQEFRQRVLDGEQRLREFTTQVSSRINSTIVMSGSDLERRVDNLERKCEHLDFINERLDQLGIEVKASETYYRDQIVPLLHRSNALQERGMK